MFEIRLLQYIATAGDVAAAVDVAKDQVEEKRKTDNDMAPLQDWPLIGAGLDLELFTTKAETLQR